MYGTARDIHHRYLTHAAFASDGRSLVTLGSDGGLRRAYLGVSFINASPLPVLAVQ